MATAQPESLTSAFVPVCASPELRESRADPRDLSEIRVFHRDRFLCRAISPEHAGETITLKDIQTARAAHRRALREHMATRRAAMAEYLPVRSNAPTDTTSATSTAPPAANPAPVTARSRPATAPSLHLYQADLDLIDFDDDADPSDGEEHP